MATEYMSEQKHTCVPVIKWFEVDPENLCQFTGLYDKNGKRIWENDIVFVTDENDCSGQISTGIGNVIFIEGMQIINSIQNHSAMSCQKPNFHDWQKEPVILWTQ